MSQIQQTKLKNNAYQYFNKAQNKLIQNLLQYWLITQLINIIIELINQQLKLNLVIIHQGVLMIYQNNFQQQLQNHNSMASSFKLLLKIQQKLQSLVIKANNNSNSTIDQLQNEKIQNHKDLEKIESDQQNRISFWQKCSQILYQLQILQILLAENNLTNFTNLINLQFPAVNPKNYSIISSPNKNNLLQIKSSFSNNSLIYKQNQEQRTQTLKSTLLTLCDQVKLDQSSKKFLKSQIQVYFNSRNQKKQNKHSNKKDSSQCNDETLTQQYLQNFISQIGQLREQIQNLTQNNQNLIKQKQQLAAKIKILESYDNLIFRSRSKYLKSCIQQNQNPQSEEISSQQRKFIQRKKWFQKISSKNLDDKPKFKSQPYTNPRLLNCQQCLKYVEQIQYLNIYIQKSEERSMQNENTIKNMNCQFSQEIIKYNKVFQKLSLQNQYLKRNVDYNLIQQIRHLQEQIQMLKEANYEMQLKARSHKWLNDLHQQYDDIRKNQYIDYNQVNYGQNPFLRYYTSRNIPQKNHHIYSKKNYSGELGRQKLLIDTNSRSRMRQVSNRSKSGNSYKNSRPNSYRSSSPNQNLKRLNTKLKANEYLKKPNQYMRKPRLNEYELI